MLATKSYLLCKEERLDVVFTVEVLLLDQLPASPSVLNPSEEENEAVSVAVLNKFLGLEVVDFFNLMKNDDNMLMFNHVLSSLVVLKQVFKSICRYRI